MVRPAGSLLAVLALVVCCGACVSKESASSDGAATQRHDGAASLADSGAPVVDSQAAADAPPTPTNCQTIRSCVYACRDDAACAARCVSGAPMAARQQWQQANACSMQACPNQADVDCRCMAECLGGDCTQVVDVCDDAASDPFCDMQCH
jgi:hypothetical protein